MTANPRERNRLADETSAYLRQHMDNPVDWYPWGDEALERARAEDKPLLVSIGYSACHWCHVMAHESFEDAETAALMNELFINVKVDREERPDVDQIYMDALTRMTGHGGWPLTAFCMPNGAPYYTGTYFPDERRHNMPAFREVLRAVHDAYRNRRHDVETTAAQVLTALAKRPEGVAEAPPGATTLAVAAREVMEGADTQYGGFGSAPKFPTPTNLEMLLAAARVAQSDTADLIRAHCMLTAREMARRGLFDQLGGGFHRYCVDHNWGIPHFEKMLYDQGLLLRFYAELYLQTAAEPEEREAELAWPMRETVAYLRREMSAPDGGFFASQDADSEGEEGKFFVWTPAQVEALLGAAAPTFCEAYGVSERGNFEGGTTHLADVARQERSEYAAERATLFAARAKRIAPATDEKRVCAWNGYAISGLARASVALDDASMLRDASAAADFVFASMRDPSGQLHRVFNEGAPHVAAFLDDHAAMLDACLDLARAGAGDVYLAHARELAETIARDFYDPDERDLFLTPAGGPSLVHRPRSDHDGATPHACGHALIGLLRIADLADERVWHRLVLDVLRTHAFVLERAPQAYPTLARAAAIAERGLHVAVVVGPPDDRATQALASRARRVLAPEDAVVVADPGGTPPPIAPSWLAGRGPLEGRPALYLCRGTECSLPITDPNEFAAARLAVFTEAVPPANQED